MLAWIEAAILPGCSLILTVCGLLVKLACSRPPTPATWPWSGIYLWDS